MIPIHVFQSFLKMLNKTLAGWFCCPEYTEVSQSKKISSSKSQLVCLWKHTKCKSNTYHFYHESNHQPRAWPHYHKAPSAMSSHHKSFWMYVVSGFRMIINTFIWTLLRDCETAKLLIQFIDRLNCSGVTKWFWPIAFPLLISTCIFHTWCY